MKRIVSFLFIVISVNTNACDICGCANGGAFFGIMPQSNQQLLGVRYRLSTFDSHLSSERFGAVERYQSFELWGRFYPFKRVQLLTYVPFNSNQQTLNLTNVTTQIKGLGDATVLVQYAVLNTFYDSTKHSLDHTLRLGAGLKLPTGKYAYDEAAADEVANPNFQLGTGSTDLLLSAIYTMRYKKWGMNTELNYRLTQENSLGYRFANRLTSAVSLFRSISVKNAILLPNLGISGEYARPDLRDGVRNEFTGGNLVQVVAGAEFYTRAFSTGFSVQRPVYQHVAGGDLAARPAISFHLTKVL